MWEHLEEGPYEAGSGYVYESGYDSAMAYDEGGGEGYASGLTEYLPETRDLVIGLTCFALGMAVMYMLDPAGGGRRRALVRDKAVRVSKRGGRALRGAARGAADHLKGVAAEARARMRHEEVDDGVLAERVRSAIGRATSHPGAIEVSAEGGTVTLRGPVLNEEMDRLVRAAERVRGVCCVENQLSVHETAGNIPGLQGE